MIADPKRKVLVSLGSSGSGQAFPALLRALTSLPVTVLIATSGRTIPASGRDAYVAELLPLTETARLSCAVVSHGGSTGVYPAVAAGTPVLGIPSNADQQLSTAVLTDSGAGLGVRVEEASVKRLRRTLEELLFEPRFRQTAREWADVFARYDSGALFRQFVAEAVKVGGCG
jgi:UDP:flavonoid glycosyltransferase YjiC (YdhE family)